MAIVTPAAVSCSDRGETPVDRAVREGADIVDIAAAGDVVPLVAAVRERYPELAIAVHTRRCEVARSVLDVGADIITWSGADPQLAELAVERKCALVCRRSRPHRLPGAAAVGDVINDLIAQAATLVGLGVSREALVIDPTHDSGTWHGLELVRHSDDLVATGWPVLMTLSDQDFGPDPDTGVADVLPAAAIAAWAGIRVLRVHQVRRTRRVLDMVASIAGTRPPARATRGLTRREPG